MWNICVLNLSFHGSLSWLSENIFYLFGQLKSKPPRLPVWAVLYEELFLPPAWSHLWRFTVVFFSAAGHMGCFPKSRPVARGGMCAETLRHLWPHHVLPRPLVPLAELWASWPLALHPSLGTEGWCFFFPLGSNRMSAQTEHGSWSSPTLQWIRWHLQECDEGASCHFSALLLGTACPRNVKELSACYSKNGPWTGN